MGFRKTHVKQFGPTAVSAAAALWTPATGKRVRLMSGNFTLTGASDTTFHILDGTAGTPGTLASIALDSGANAISVDFGHAGCQATAVTVPLGIKADSGTGTVVATLVGREEGW